MNENSELDMISMNIIANAGQAKSLVFEALKEAKENNFDRAEELIKEAETSINEVHKVQMDLLVDEANGNKKDINILLVHAQDHFMTTLLAYDLIKEMIEVYKR